MNHPSETGRTVGGELPGEGERVVLQPALTHHLHVPHEVQQVPLRQPHLSAESWFHIARRYKDDFWTQVPAANSES